MRWKKAGIFLLLALLVLLAGCKEKEEASSSNTVPPATVTAPPDEAVSTSEVGKVKAAVVSGTDVGLNVRDAASTEGNVLGLAENGTKLRLLDTEKIGDFYMVSYQGKTGYVYYEYVVLEDVQVTQLTEVEEQTPEPQATSTPPGTENSTSTAQATETPVPTTTPEADFAVTRDGET